MSSYIIQDRIEISLSISGVPYPLSHYNTLDMLQIGCSTAMRFPTLCFQITDVDRFFDTQGLQDAAPIIVSIREGQAQARSYKFRLFSSNKMFNGSSWVYVIDAMYDSPLWTTGTINKSYSMASSQVISALAAECSLNVELDGTNDNQLWTPQARTRANFAHTVCSSGFIDDTSCMILAFDMDGTLVYRNINNLKTATMQVVAYQQSENAFTALDVQEVSGSGLNNALTGYWDTRVRQSVVDAVPQTTYDSLSFTSDSRNPLYSQKQKAVTKAGAVKFGPIDVGNVSAKSERAAYQNARYRNLFSSNLQLMFGSYVNYRLLDQLNLSIQKEDASSDQSTSGLYTITSHNILLQGANYMERLGVTRHGTNVQYKG